MADIKARLSIGQGEQGPRGLQGPQGRPGIQGPVGPKGERGEKGEQGIPGPVGPKGQDGSVAWSDLSEEQKASLRKELKGEKGDIGPAGPQGKQGIQGLVGPKGDTGLTGPQGPEGRPSTVPGPKGEAGPQGPIGKTGASGPQGPKGEQGLVGPAGKTGPQGPAGPIGPQGPAGAAGKDGKDIHFFKTKNSFNYASWLDYGTRSSVVSWSSPGDIVTSIAKTKVGDVVALTGNVSDKPGMKMIIYGIVETKNNTEHMLVLPTGIANLNDATGGGTVDAYTKAETDKKFFGRTSLSELKNINEITVSGYYKTSSSTVGLPDGAATYGILEAIDKDGGGEFYELRYYVIASNHKYLNTLFIKKLHKTESNKSTPWKKIATTDDLHGAKIIKMPTSKNYSAIKSCADSAFDAVGEYSITDLDSINIGDFVIIKVQAKDMNNATCMIFAKRIPSAYGSNPRFEGLGMSTAVDTYSKTEADAKFATKEEIKGIQGGSGSVVNEHGAKIGKYNDNKYLYDQWNSYVKTRTFIYMDQITLEGKEKLKQGDYLILSTKPTDRNYNIYIYLKVFKIAGNELHFDGLGMSTAVDAYTKSEVNGLTHGAKIYYQKNKSAYTFSQLKTYSNIDTYFGYGNFVQDKMQKAKLGDFIIMNFIPNDRDETITIYGVCRQEDESQLYYTGLGMSSGIDAYSRTETDNTFLKKSDAESKYLNVSKADKRYAKKDEVTGVAIKPGNITNGSNLDTITGSGYYQVHDSGSSAHASFPKEAHPYGILEVITTTDNVHKQIYTANKDANNTPQVYVRTRFQGIGWSQWTNVCDDATIDYSRKEQADLPSYFYDNHAGKSVMLYKNSAKLGAIGDTFGDRSTMVYVQVITPKQKSEGRVVMIAHDSKTNKMAKRCSTPSDGWTAWQLVSGPSNSYSLDKAERLEAQVAELTVKYERLLAKLGLEDEEADIPTTGGTLEEHEHNTFEDILNQYIPDTKEETLKDKFN